MKLYHGTSEAKAESIIEHGRCLPEFNDNSYSSAFDEGGLYCSNVREYAEQYGNWLVEVDVAESEILWIQECPISEDDLGWQPEFVDAVEYMIPADVEFVAKLA